MLLPLGVLIPEGERVLKFLLLKCGEDFLHVAWYGIVPEVIYDPGQDQDGKGSGEDQVPAAAGGRFVVLLRIHQGHGLLSIIESGEIEKVPAPRLFAVWSGHRGSGFRASGTISRT